MPANCVPALPSLVLSQSRLTPNRNSIDDATKTEEYVPIITPHIIAKTNPCR